MVHDLREYEYKWVVYNEGLLTTDLVQSLNVSDNVVLVEEVNQEALDTDMDNLFQVNVKKLHLYILFNRLSYIHHCTCTCT